MINAKYPEDKDLDQIEEEMKEEGYDRPFSIHMVKIGFTVI